MMSRLLTTLATAVVAFASTNIDDIFVLTFFFSQTSRGFRSSHIVAGQYLGFTALIAISLVGFIGGRILPQAWVGLLGVVPVLVGIRRWIHRHDAPVHVKVSAAASTTTVAAVTFANGGDNIGIYTPLFASSDSRGLTTTLVTFYLLLGLWCFIGYAVTRHRAVGRVLVSYGHIVVPFVLVGLGIYIMAESGTLRLLGFWQY
jgi:cadmium resistance transport/sequestration family protein